jgi:ABC-type cobalamin transport system ATPase subunit
MSTRDLPLLPTLRPLRLAALGFSACLTLSAAPDTADGEVELERFEILADEPTTNLDEVNEAKVFEIFQRLHAQGKTIVIATHDPALGGLTERKILLRHGRSVEDQRNGGAVTHAPLHACTLEVERVKG